MREAVIVSTARTPIGKAYRGSFNNLASPTLAGHAISAAVARAGIEPDRIEDCIMGAALTQGSQGGNIGRTGTPRGPASHRVGHDDRSSVLLRHDGCRDCGQAGHS